MDMVQIHMVRNSTDSQGNPLFRFREYAVGEKLAENLYRRGAAVSAAQVLVDRLVALGVTGITILPSKDAETLMRSCERAGIEILNTTKE